MGARPTANDAVAQYVRAYDAAAAAGFPVHGTPGTGNKTTAASAAMKALNLSRNKAATRLERAVREGLIKPFGSADSAPPPKLRVRVQANSAPHLAVDPLPDADEPIDDLLNRKRVAFDRRLVAETARQLIPVQVRIDGPYGILHMGDPHIDDDGCDMATLDRHLGLIDRTPGLFAANVGDLSNNWIGRLARLYAAQSTTASDAWRLVEWLIGRVPWLYIVGGNHDVWSGAADPVRWFMRQSDGLYRWHGMRLELRPPSGQAVRVNARHDFPGTSMWNAAHAASKAARMGYARDHIYTCGHRHAAAQNLVVFDNGAHIAHAVRVGTYKAFDDFADAKGFPRENLPAVVTIINPHARHETGLVQVEWDIETAADYLTFLRRRHAA